MSVTWNGRTITGPVLIYLDEILVDSYNTTAIGDPDRQGALICRSEDRAGVNWLFTDNKIVSTAPTNSFTTFKQIRTSEGVIPSISRFSLNKENFVEGINRTNGLWHCRLNAMGQVEQIHVGIYSSGEGKNG